MAKLKTEAELTKELKAYALKVANELPKRLLKGDKATPKATYRKRPHRIELDQIEASYNQLDGEWRDWLEVAKRYEHKVPYQDRGDLRHTIILELALARQKTTEPIPLYRAYRIASFMVADYYRQQLKLNTGLDCRHCSKAKRQECKKHNLYSECPKLIKLVSLDTVTVDAEGNSFTLKDTIADDKAIDLDAWLDQTTWLLGCPTRLVEIAHKKRLGKPLSWSDYKYWERGLKKSQKALF